MLHGLGRHRRRPPCRCCRRPTRRFHCTVGTAGGACRRYPPRGYPQGIAGTASLPATDKPGARRLRRSEEHTSELQSLMRISYAVFCLKQNKTPESKKELTK